MRNPRLARVYAKSLLDFAKGSDQVDAVFEDMQFVKSVCKTSPDFDYVLSSPIIKNDKKASIVKAVLKDKITPASWAFISLVIEKNRAEYLSQIAQSVIEQYEVLNGIHEVFLTTAIILDDHTRDLIVNALKSETGIGKVKLNSKTDPSLIGGFVLEFDNKLVDASISRKLNDLKLLFADKSYSSAI